MAEEHHGPHAAEGTQRIEAFSDGVFAIAITLLIIEIGVPHVTAEGSLADALGDLWPSYFAYALSFVTIGIYWANHNAFFRLFHATDHGFLMINVFFLMAVAFLPFPTAVLGDYLKESEHRDTAVTLYASALLAPALTWFGMWLWGNWRGLVDERLAPDYSRFLTGLYIFSCAVYVIAVGVSFLNSWAGFGICVVITGVYFFPPRRPRFVG